MYLKNVFLSGKTKDALAKFQKGYCPVCEMSLFNGEKLETHHILPQRKGGDNSLKNLKLLHKVCHKQVEYLKDSTLRAVWKERGIYYQSEKKDKNLYFFLPGKIRPNPLSGWIVGAV